MLGFTIDSIKLFIGWEELYEYDFSTLKEKLRSVRSKKKYNKNRTDSTIWISGFYKNFKISYSEDYGIYISGSISNFYKGYKSLLKYSELKTAIEKLGSELELYLNDSRLYRIDLALNIQTDKPIKQYSHYLFSDLSKFKRLEQHKGVLFTTTSKSFSIYNKSLELKDKRDINIPNILRFEFRLLKGVSKFFRIKKMKISDLYNPNIFLKLLYGFQGTYDRIEKARVLKDFSEIEYITPTILKKWREASSLIQQAEMYRLIEQADLEGKFKTRNDKSRCRKDIKNLSYNEFITEPHPLALEISEKINLEIEKLKTELTTTKSEA